MLNPVQDLARRRPVWQALADLFLDTVLNDLDYGYIAEKLVSSGYTSSEIQAILWDEVFPTVEFNMRHPAGEWVCFDADWLQEKILGLDKRKDGILAQLSEKLAQRGTASIIQERWQKLLGFLPDDFQHETRTR